MKKVLMLTDGSLDMALSLRKWLDSQHEPIDLTVVYAYTLTDLLTTQSYRLARQQAINELDAWLAYLPTPWPGKLQAETLLGDAELVMKIHLLIRRYDYLLIDFWQKDVLAAFVSCEDHITTELHCLGLLQSSSFSHDLRQTVQPHV